MTNQSPYLTMQATMLKKTKCKRRLTEPHITPGILGLASNMASATSSSTALQTAAAMHSENSERDKDSTATST